MKETGNPKRAAPLIKKSFGMVEDDVEDKVNREKEEEKEKKKALAGVCK